MDRHRETPRFGFLAQIAGACFSLQVCRSRSGYYIGTRDQTGQPFSRESAEYWQQVSQAEAALREGQWTQRLAP